MKGAAAGNNNSRPATPVDSDRVQRLLDELPQTQCTRCGYDDCAGYAQAIAAGEAAINQCPPGGREGVWRLARLTGQPELPLNPEHGTEGPRGVAWIDESWCIGCTLCIEACPVDCIIGSNKLMHTIIESACTGCELCVEACPVDCIHMEPVTGERSGWAAWSSEQAESARQRYQATTERRERAAEKQAAKRLRMPKVQAEAPAATRAKRVDSTLSTTQNDKSATIAAALARARKRRQG